GQFDPYPQPGSSDSCLEILCAGGSPQLDYRVLVVPYHGWLGNADDFHWTVESMVAKARHALPVPLVLILPDAYGAVRADR
nr:hypothetical protein [Tanacetum cinerariifolium]